MIAMLPAGFFREFLPEKRSFPFEGLIFQCQGGFNKNACEAMLDATHASLLRLSWELQQSRAICDLSIHLKSFQPKKKSEL